MACRVLAFQVVKGIFIKLYPELTRYFWPQVTLRPFFLESNISGYLPGGLAKCSDLYRSLLSFGVSSLQLSWIALPMG